MLKPAFQEACRARLRRAGARDRGRRPGGAGRPALGRGRRALQRHGAARPAGRIEAVRFKVDLPNYGVFDEKRVFRAGPVARADRLSRRAHRRADLRGHLGAGPGRMHPRDRRRDPARRPTPRLTSATSSRSARTIAVARVVESGLPLIYLNQVGGQDELVFEGASFALNADRSARRAIARLPHRGRAHRLGARRQTAGAASRARARRSRRATRPTMRPACWACATMSRTTAFPASCSASRAASIRRSARRWRSTRSGRRASTRSCCPIASPRTNRCRDAAACAEGARHPLRHRADRRAGRGRRARAGDDVRRPAARHHRGEHPEPRARPDPDVDLQQVRRDGGDDRQQVGNVGRLRHALRRHERRLQSDQGPLQDGGLPPRPRCATAGSRTARWGRTARSSRANIIVKPPTAELRENQKDEDSLPPYPVLDAHPARAGRKGDARSPTSSPRATTPRRCAGSSGCSISPNTSAASRRRASRSDRRISAATGAIRSSIASATPACRRRRPTRRSRRAGRQGRASGSRSKRRTAPGARAKLVGELTPGQLRSRIRGVGKC